MIRPITEAFTDEIQSLRHGGERYAEIGGFSGAVVQTVGYGADGGGDGFLIVTFADGRVLRADSRGQASRIEINTK